jgi:Holliday junction DNA helicase RuvA
MIGKITGVIDHVSTDHILVDVSGIGYVIFVTGTTLNKLPVVGQKISLFTELVVREDLLQLIGFVTPIEREWYKLLTSVQGVGSKAALALLGHIPIKTLSRAILLEDSETIKAAQGIGPKIAKRLVLELKGKVPSMLTLAGQSTTMSTNEQAILETQGVGNTSVLSDDQIDQSEIGELGNAELDAISGLANLGYSQIDAAKVVAEILNQSNSTIKVEELIRLALKILATKG